VLINTENGINEPGESINTNRLQKITATITTRQHDKKFKMLNRIQIKQHTQGKPVAVFL
jgi:hypothetical protein